MGRNKYLVIDREIEEGFLAGDLKVVGAIIGRSHRTVEKWLHRTRYRDEGRFIIVKNPLVAVRKHRPTEKQLAVLKKYRNKRDIFIKK